MEGKECPYASASDVGKPRFDGICQSYPLLQGSESDRFAA